MDTKAWHGETSAFHWKVLWTFLRRSSYRPVGTPQRGLEMEFTRGNFFWGGSRENGQESKMRTFSFLAKVHANHWLAWRYVTGQSRSGTHWGVVVDYQINWSHSTRIWYIVYRSTVAIAGVYRAFSLWKSVMFPEWSTVNGCFRSLKDGMWPNHHSNPNRTPKIRGDTKHHHVWNETPKVKKQLVWDPF